MLITAALALVLIGATLPAVVAIHRPLRPLLYSPTTLRALSDR